MEAIINPSGPEVQEGRRQVEALIKPRLKTRGNEKLRKSGRIPGVVHGVDDAGKVLKHLVHVDKKWLNREIRELGQSLENTAYDVTIKDDEGSTLNTYCVTPRQLAINPLTGDPTSVNFLKFERGTKMRLPLNYINKDLCVDLKRGCFLLRVNQFVEVLVDDVDLLPKHIDVDLSGASKNSVLTLENMTFPPCVRPSHRVHHDYVAAVVKAK